MTNDSPIHVSYAKTVYGQKEIDAVVACLKRGTQMGFYSGQFERQIADLFAKKYGIFVNSGSSALFIGMEAEAFPEGSEVITPALTFSTTVGCILKCGLVPAFVDVGADDYCIDVSQIEAMITNKTVAILAPNLMGNICQWRHIQSIAKSHGLRVIEDSADTLGATLDDQSSGMFSDWAITSFYGSHIINCAGNGGMLCTNDDEHLRKSKLLRSWGRSSSLFDDKSEAIENRFNVKVDGVDYDAKFIFESIGYNLEGSEVGAAFGLAQLEDLSQNITIRQQNMERQLAFFAEFEDLFILPKQTPGSSSGWLAFPIIIREDAPFCRRDFQIYLERRNIQTRTVFTGNIMRQPGFIDQPMRTQPMGYPHADNVMKNGVLLACHHGLTDNMMQHMHATIRSFISDQTNS